ncbi:hypothetical protein ACL6C3_26015 [Capilliphycus salinus ALCB114379]|uniref:hypothetical protein n=1 Tax=Capilliphycus salinus TaxID=2768948 RepID=UPI0039A49F3D
MLNRNYGWTTLRKRLISAIAAILVLNLLGCQQPQLPEPSLPNLSAPQPTTEMGEASPPRAIQLLHQPLDIYQPQITILSPQPDEILQDNTLTVQLQVQDLPLFQDETLGLGPHLQVLLDNQPLENIYTLDEPLVLSDLEAGTHTLRIFAAYPWEESFKNDGAYAQTTFHIFTKTPENNPDPKLPLLTYNQPRGTIGAEPVLLDFYLANAPLHLVALENPEDEIVDWRIRVTVNGKSFIIDRWQPIYIKGIKPGKNWVQLEYLDELGEPLINVYNKTARVFTYDPNSQDTLSKLVRGELTLAEARPIVDPGYDLKVVTPQVEETPEIEETAEPAEIEIVPPVEQETPEIEQTSEPTEIEIVTPQVEETPEIEQTAEPAEIETVPPVEEETPEIEETAEPAEIETVPPVEEETPETESPVEPAAETEDIEVIPGGSEIPSTIEETSETAVEEVSPTEEEPSPSPIPATGGWFNRIKGQIPPLPVFEKNNTQTSPIVTPSETSEPSETDNVFKGIFSRFKQIPLFQQNTSQPSPQPSPEPVETLPEIVDQAPIPEPTQPTEPEESPELVPEELKPSSEISPTQPTVETVEPVIEPSPEPEPVPEIIEETSVIESEPVPEIVEETSVIESEPVPEIVEETDVIEAEPIPEIVEETDVIEAEPVPKIVEETDVIESEPVPSEPVIITPEAEPEPLPEIIDQTPVVEPEVELEESNLRP